MVVAGLIWLVFTVLRWLVLIAADCSAGQVPGPAGWLSFAGAFDGGHFAEIAASGYTNPGSVTPIRQAFFPGYPVDPSGAVQLYTRGDGRRRMRLAAFTVTTISSFIATVLVYRLAAERLDRAGGCPRRVVADGVAQHHLPDDLLLRGALSGAAPTAAWSCATHGWWWAAGLLSAGACLHDDRRLPGCGAASHAAGGRASRTRAVRLVETAGGRDGLCGGSRLRLLHLWRLTGDLFASWRAQTKGWGRETVSPWPALINTVNRFRRADHRRLHACAAGGRHRRRGLRMHGDGVPGWPSGATGQGLRSDAAHLRGADDQHRVLVGQQEHADPVSLFVLGGCLLARRPSWVSAVVLSITGSWMLVMTGVVVVGAWPHPFGLRLVVPLRMGRWPAALSGPARRR